MFLRQSFAFSSLTYLIWFCLLLWVPSSFIHVYRRSNKLRGLSLQADRPSDHRLSEKLVPTLVARGCRVVSATIPPQSLISVF
jgi:hypothetical protein